MSNVVAISPSSAFTGAQLQLIRNTVARDCNPAEFDLFVTVARNVGLDPFRKQISAIVFSKDNPKKRRMSIITGIDGLRAIAARSNRYRPDEDEPVITYDPELKSPTNPLGIEKALVRIYIADAQREGGWKPVSGVAYWDEFAPIKDDWAEGEDGKRRPTGKQTLDGNWPKMPRVMISKCAEAQALRKAFPEDMSSLYESSELDRAQADDLTPSEMIDGYATQDRLARIGVSSGIMLQFLPNTAIESVPLGKVADRVIETVKGIDTIHLLQWFESANRQPLQEFWARTPGDALAVKKEIEAQRTTLEKAERGQ